MVSIKAILANQTIPGITANKTPESKAVFSPYISLAILQTTNNERSENVTATSRPVNTLAPANAK